MSVIGPKKILCVGMMTCDVYFYGVSPDYFSREVSVNSGVRMMTGGDATNVSIDLAALGNDVKLMGCIGNDIQGDGLLKATAAAGVDNSCVVRRDGVSTSTTLIVYTEDSKDSGDRHCSLYHGGNEHLMQEDITDEILKSVTHMHYGSFGPMTAIDGPELKTLFARAKALGVTVSMDIKGMNHDFSKLMDALPYVDLFMPNIGEHRAITGTDDLEAIKAFYAPFRFAAMAVKMAEKGVFVTDFKEDIMLPTMTRQDEIVDIMGAGDAFCAGMMTAWLDGRDLYECGVLGSMASRACLMTEGASNWRAKADNLAREAVRMGFPVKGF